MPSLIRSNALQSLTERTDELPLLLARLVGKPFLFLRASYGDELTIHLGHIIPLRNPRFKKLRKGTYIVAARASCWILDTGGIQGTLYTSDDFSIVESSARIQRIDYRELETSETILPGSIATDAIFRPTPSGLMLILAFSDGSNLAVLPRPVNRPEEVDPLSDWEIFMPNHRVLKAGPGNAWSYVDSGGDQSPIEQQSTPAE